MMLNPIIASLVYQSEMLISYIFYSNVSEKRKSSPKVWVIGFVLFELGTMANLLSGNNALINVCISVLVHVVFSIACFHIPIRIGAFYAVILMALSTALEFAMAMLISALMKSQPLDFSADPLLFIMECPASKLLYFIITMAISKAMNDQQYPRKMSLNILFFPIAMLMNLLVIFYVCVANQIASDGQYLVALSCMVMCVVTILLVLNFQEQVEKDREHMQIQNEYKRLNMEKAYYDILDQQNQQLLMYAHDVKNHLAAIQNLSTEPSVHAYVSKLSGQINSYTRTCHSGNMMLDVMINKYVIECDRHGVSFDYNVKLYNMGDIEDLDLVSILGNLMDNALDAAEASNRKEVFLETTYRNTYHVLLIRNSSLPPKELNGHLVTSKIGSTAHGFGLKSVAKTLIKYQGDLQWDYDASSQTFTMTVMIGGSVPLNTFHS